MHIQRFQKNKKHKNAKVFFHVKQNKIKHLPWITEKPNVHETCKCTSVRKHQGGVSVSDSRLDHLPATGCLPLILCKWQVCHLHVTLCTQFTTLHYNNPLHNWQETDEEQNANRAYSDPIYCECWKLKADITLAHRHIMFYVFQW